MGVFNVIGTSVVGLPKESVLYYHNFTSVRIAITSDFSVIGSVRNKVKPFILFIYLFFFLGGGGGNYPKLAAGLNI